MTFAVVPASAENWPRLEDLFGRSGASNGCWCMYWLLGPEYHRRPRERNREQLRAQTRDEPPPGLLALDGDRAVGWCRVGPRDDLPWLDHARHLARVDDVPVCRVTCFYIRRTHRDQGVATALVEAAVEHARNEGAPVLEAYPVDTSVPGATSNTFPGTATIFERAGFTTVTARTASRPIMRREL